jgi:hypothetical protein
MSETTKWTVYSISVDEDDSSFFLRRIGTVRAESDYAAVAALVNTTDRWYRRSDYRVYRANEKRKLSGYLRRNSQTLRQYWNDVRDQERFEGCAQAG